VLTRRLCACSPVAMAGANNMAVEAEAPTGGVGKLLSDMKLNFFELIILIAFWVGVVIASSVVSLDMVLSACRAPRRASMRARAAASRGCTVHARLASDGAARSCRAQASRPWRPPLALWRWPQGTFM
jgi:hypothetical protein